MKIIELILDEEQEESGIDAISIVESPAIESDFVALNSQEIKLAETLWLLQATDCSEGM